MTSRRALVRPRGEPPGSAALRRRGSSAVASDARTRSRPASAPRRRRRPRPRRGTPARLAAARRPRRRGRPGSAARRSRCCPWSMPSSGSMAMPRTASSPGPPSAAGSSAPRRPRARAATCCWPPIERHATADRELRRRGRAAGSRRRAGGAPCRARPSNLKVTVPEDLALARRLAARTRRLAQRRRRTTAIPSGRRRPAARRPATSRAHRDCTATPTATSSSTRSCDGLLAAAGCGDLGRLFPAGDPATRDIDSRELLREVLRPARVDRARGATAST